MIYLDSRYVSSPLVKAWNPRKKNYSITVPRQWPNYYTNYFIYEWIETDRLDILAHRFLGNAALWWRILDLNPEVLDPLSIPPGKQLRIPNV